MKNQLAVQLYTVRDFLKTGPELAQSLAKIREIGYTAVQLSAVGAMEGDSPEVDAKTARQMLDDNGLKCAATHVGWNSIRSNTEAEIEIHHTLDCDYTAIGSLPGVFGGEGYGGKGVEGYKQFVTDAEPVIAKLKAAGIKFGYHNHASEFQSENGQVLYDVLLQNTDPKLVNMELDLGWVVAAGKDPFDYFKKYKGRFPLWHLKDMKGTRSTEFGTGDLDMAALLNARKDAGLKYFFVEQEEYSVSPLESMKINMAYLQSFKPH
ncbi:sugar phosphate isomerase/epimerase [bacterium]|nr:MAG: sugar phosphate isomerase/epimerase [bacterium]